MSARRGGGGARVAPLDNKKKMFKNNLPKNFNLQKAPIVCYARNFYHKRPPCYALHFHLKRPPY